MAVGNHHNGAMLLRHSVQVSCRCLMTRFLIHVNRYSRACSWFSLNGLKADVIRVIGPVGDTGAMQGREAIRTGSCAGGDGVPYLRRPRFGAGPRGTPWLPAPPVRDYHPYLPPRAEIEANTISQSLQASDCLSTSAGSCTVAGTLME